MPTGILDCPALVPQLDQVSKDAADRRVAQLGAEIGIDLGDDRLRRRVASSERRHDLIFADSAMRDVACDQAGGIVDGPAVGRQQHVRPQVEHSIERFEVGRKISASPAGNDDRGAGDDEIAAEERSTFGLEERHVVRRMARSVDDSKPDVACIELVAVSERLPRHGPSRIALRPWQLSERRPRPARG
jgi:hypothetical protein